MYGDERGGKNISLELNLVKPAARCFAFLQLMTALRLVLPRSPSLPVLSKPATSRDNVLRVSASLCVLAMYRDIVNLL